MPIGFTDSPTETDEMTETSAAVIRPTAIALFSIAVAAVVGLFMESAGYL